ncbi:unnamed protein product [Rhizoctonia solani]|uniref:Uncharacterized protein n=1 Tax=Rhizoctonia solani TaxID=456999 RepID=A0A8H3E1N0_9AGAM|nr:unnamed protein product [Rhizoctonia solani]
MGNVQGLPPCPPDISEPHYLALLFARECMGCGQSIGATLYGELRVRFCRSCRHSRLVVLNGLDPRVDRLIYRSPEPIRVPLELSGPPVSCAIRVEADAIREKFKELLEAGDTDVLDAWEQERRMVTIERIKEARAIRAFLKSWKPNMRGLKPK